MMRWMPNQALTPQGRDVMSDQHDWLTLHLIQTFTITTIVSKVEKTWVSKSPTQCILLGFVEKAQRCAF